ncbi:MAG: hypothetical protein H7066_18225 [Cytophagaceae bacterium]|nr:hypothetical protein [Gemmatimonadaceae bacterium]
MRTIIPSSLLRTALLADAAASGLVGLLQVIAAAWLSRLTNFPQGLVLATGLFLLAYAALLVFTARSATVAWALIATIIVGNLAWAVACMTLLAIDALTPTGVGVLFIMLQVVTVFSFAGLEVAGLRASRDAVVDDGRVVRA